MEFAKPLCVISTQIVGSSLVILYRGLTSRCARLFQWDVFRCVEVSTLVPAADSLSVKHFGRKCDSFRRVKVRELIALIEADGWLQVRQKGSHRHHQSKPGTVTVSGKPSVDVPAGTLNSALKQAGLE